MASRSRIAFLLLLGILVVSYIQLGGSNTESLFTVSKVSASSVDNAVVYFIDVGQGDSIFIKMENKTILIDGGPRSAGSTVLSFLSSINVTQINFVIATHPDEDHIGGLVSVLQSLSVDVVLYNGQNRTTQVFKDFMNLAALKNLTLAERNQFYFLTSSSNFTLLNPVQPLEFAETNLNSIVTLFKVGRVSFLFAGDAEVATEQSMLNVGLHLGSNVLKVGHHGSSTSTSQAFLDVVKPSIAVISAGVNNQYGHPANETVQRLRDFGVVTYGTFASGTIVLSTDGNVITVQGNPKPIPEFSSIAILTVMLSVFVAVVVLKRRKPLSISTG